MFNYALIDGQWTQLGNRLPPDTREVKVEAAVVELAPKHNSGRYSTIRVRAGSGDSTKELASIPVTHANYSEVIVGPGIVA